MSTPWVVAMIAKPLWTMTMMMIVMYEAQHFAEHSYLPVLPRPRKALQRHGEHQGNKMMMVMMIIIMVMAMAMMMMMMFMIFMMTR